MNDNVFSKYVEIEHDGNQFNLIPSDDFKKYEEEQTVSTMALDFSITCDTEEPTQTFVNIYM